MIDRLETTMNVGGGQNVRASADVHFRVVYCDKSNAL